MLDHSHEVRSGINLNDVNCLYNFLVICLQAHSFMMDIEHQMKMLVLNREVLVILTKPSPVPSSSYHDWLSD